MTPQLDLVGIAVADIGRSRAFYARLGLEFPEGDDHVEATVGGMRVALDSEAVMRSFDPSWEAGGRGRIGLAFLCDSPDEVDRLHTELAEAGGGSHLEPFDAFWGQRYAVVRDPDGNHVDLFAPLETR